MGWLLCISFLLSIACLVQADDKPYCSQPKPQKSDITKPIIPSQFNVHVQMIDVLKESVTEMTEYYDGPGNRAVVFISENAGKSKRYYRYDQQLFLEISEDIGLCISVPISVGDHMMGFKLKNGTRKILSPSAALRFNAPGQIEIYKGSKVIRGINTDHWYSCLNLKDPRADLEVNWYFSNADQWDPSSSAEQVPVRSYIKGIAYESETIKHNIEQYYEYYHYRPGLPKDKTVFDTPRGLLCNDGKYPKMPPKIPSIMSFRLELVDTQMQDVTYSDEVYDFETLISKHVYKSPKLFTYSLNPLTVINDFNTGVSYNIDMTFGNCTVRPISQLPIDAKTVDSRHVRMTQPQEFFQLQNHFYQGVRTTRDIECDVWIGKKLNKHQKANYTTEWYFARPKVVGGETVTSSTLVQYAEYRNDELMPAFYFNIFDFTQDEPDILQFDIKRCYTNVRREAFNLYFDKKYEIHITSSLNKFKLYLATSVSLALKISPLRVQNIEVDPTGGYGVIASFELMDAAPKIGDVKHPIKEQDLKTVANKLHQLLKDKKLEVYLQNYKSIITVKPVEFTETISTSIVPTTYSGTSMFGLALGMTVIGMILAALIVFKIYTA